MSGRSSIPFRSTCRCGELFGAWITGAKLVIVSHLTSRSPEEFCEFIRSRAVTVLSQTPSAFRELLTRGRLVHSQTHPLALRSVVLAGEPLELSMLQSWFEAFGSSCPRVVNMYGITETTVHSTYRHITRADITDNLGSPIGRALPSVQTTVFDTNMRVLAKGLRGEIYVGGAGVSRGFFGQPALTAQRFVPNPVSQQLGDRLYRSGDRAMRSEAGELRYLGRLDHLIKLRGFRIDPNEIERALREHPFCLTAVAMLRFLDEGDERLVAVAQRAAGGHLTPEVALMHLRERLPSHMVPSVVLVVDSLPRTANGKIDRKEILALVESAGHARTTVEAAEMTPTEEVIRSIWVKTLGVESIGKNTNFFEVGGHSLVATKVIISIREAFGVDLPMRQIFVHPTVADLAAQVDLEQGQERDHEISVIKAPAGTELAPSLSQRGLWYFHQLDPEDPLYNIPAAMRFRGPLQVSVLEHCLAELGERHAVLRSEYPSRDGQPVMRVRAQLAFAIQTIDLAGLEHESRLQFVEDFGHEEIHRPFDLTVAPLWRSSLLRLGDADHVFFLTVHHMLADWWSLSILEQELIALYEALSRGKSSPFLDLQWDLADYVYWQQRRLEQGALARQLSYWKERLSRIPAAIDLPFDHDCPAWPRHQGRSVSRRLSPEDSVGLEKFCLETKVTEFMTTLAVFQLLLHRYAGQDVIVVGTPLTNRNRSEFSQILGFLTNTVAIAADFHLNPTFSELLVQVRESVLDAQENQDLPFEQIVDGLQPERVPGRHPIFQVMLVLQPRPTENFRLRDLEVAHVSLDQQVAHFDLAAMIDHRPGDISIRFQYDVDLFDEPTITSMLDHYEALIRSALNDPNKRVTEFPLAASDADAAAGNADDRLDGDAMFGFEK